MLLCVVVCVLFANQLAYAASAPAAHDGKMGVDSIDLTIATREVGDADLASGIYIYHLKCSRSCELTRITLNKCSKENKDAASFTPTSDHWVGSDWISAQQTSNKIRLKVYQAFGQQLPAEMFWTFNSEGGRLTTLRNLTTTGFIDYSQFPSKLAPIEFEPIPLDRSKTLDCPVALKGLGQ
jgi:hypothetical protein